MSFIPWSSLAKHLLLSSLPSRFMNMAVPASFFQRDMATETAGFFGGSTLDSVDSVFDIVGLFSGTSGSPGAVVTVGGGVNGVTLELAVLTRPNLLSTVLLSIHSLPGWLVTVPFENILVTYYQWCSDIRSIIQDKCTIRYSHYRFHAMGLRVSDLGCLRCSLYATWYVCVAVVTSTSHHSSWMGDLVCGTCLARSGT